MFIVEVAKDMHSEVLHSKGSGAVAGVGYYCHSRTGLTEPLATYCVAGRGHPTS